MLGVGPCDESSANGEDRPALGVGPRDELQMERTVLRWESDHVTKVLRTERTVLRWESDHMTNCKQGGRWWMTKIRFL